MPSRNICEPVHIYVEQVPRAIIEPGDKVGVAIKDTYHATPFVLYQMGYKLPSAYSLIVISIADSGTPRDVLNAALAPAIVSCSLFGTGIESHLSLSKSMSPSYSSSS